MIVHVSGVEIIRRIRLQPAVPKPPAFVRSALNHIDSVLGLDPPFALGVAAFGFVGAANRMGSMVIAGHEIDVDPGLVPLLVINDPTVADLDEQILQRLDVIWQSAGMAGAPRVTEG